MPTTNDAAKPFESLMRVVARLAGNKAAAAQVKEDEASLEKMIEDFDSAVVLLLNERAKANSKLLELRGPGDGVPSAELKSEQISRILSANSQSAGPLKDNMVVSVFQEVSRMCSQLRHTVAYLGPPATFTHQASRSRFGINANYLQCERINDIFAAVEKGTADFGIAPIENSTEGAISQTLDLLAASDLEVVGEVCLDIRQSLLSRAPLSRVRAVYSHPQALAQCRGWLQQNAKGAEIIAESSTARAAQLAAEARPEDGVAAISSELAAELYHVPVIASSIQDLKTNITRFAVLRKGGPPGADSHKPSGDDKTMLVICTSDRVGALHGVLDAFKSRSINLSRIESRPSKTKAWEYIFFVDVHGHRQDEPIQQVLDQLAKDCESVRVLGSFPFVRTEEKGAVAVPPAPR